MARGNPNPSPLTRFQPGDAWTGNPGGRPTGRSFAAILREALDAEHKKAPTWKHALVALAITRAAEGDLDALKWIADRTDGKVAEKVEQSGQVTHVVEVTYSRRAHPAGPAGAARGPGDDQA